MNGYVSVRVGWDDNFDRREGCVLYARTRAEGDFAVVCCMYTSFQFCAGFSCVVLFDVLAWAFVDVTWV